MISIFTLSAAISAVEEKIHGLREQIAVADDPDLSLLEEELLCFSKARMELKELYVKEQRGTSNFPTYDELIRMTPAS
ncbi:hypothetical protein [Dyella mobilis]|uniref:Uncharacterized protein n=1 Tax=Dyella mobilis TaxID=1849582 RepID=A0ABS2KA73_9GAMM|nr:hypothetical protein [Dyella mobilis]MBM7127955.1 hypothetical protein [Dyella mobilis]GLQ99223.1 hypothetical protein GCM10007863_36430 [Dyella mobilis]